MYGGKKLGKASVRYRQESRACGVHVVGLLSLTTWRTNFVAWTRQQDAQLVDVHRPLPRIIIMSSPSATLHNQPVCPTFYYFSFISSAVVTPSSVHACSAVHSNLTLLHTTTIHTGTPPFIVFYYPVAQLLNFFRSTGKVFTAGCCSNQPTQPLEYYDP